MQMAVFDLRLRGLGGRSTSVGAVTCLWSSSWLGAKPTPALDLLVSVPYQGLPELTHYCVPDDRKGS